MRRIEVLMRRHMKEGRLPTGFGPPLQTPADELAGRRLHRDVIVDLFTNGQTQHVPSGTQGLPSETPSKHSVCRGCPIPSRRIPSATRCFDVIVDIVWWLCLHRRLGWPFWEN